jgi:DNA-directed RNA polymerase subunit RPC12/RpoP
MRAGKIIAFITAAVFIIFGFLFILGAFSPEGSPSWIFVGIVGLLIGFVLIFVGTKLSPPQKAGDQVVNLQVDLPGDVSMDTIKCQSCGAPLNANDIKMIAGAPVVECPSCGTTYQLTEEPKW